MLITINHLMLGWVLTWLIDNYIELIAVLAYDSVSTCKDRSKEITLFSLMANNVEGILNNYRLKAYPQEKVFMFSYNWC